MKKIISILVAVTFAAAGLVSVGSTTANAAGCSKYTGCVDTVTTAAKPKVKGKKVSVKVTTTAAGVDAVGTYKFVIKKKGKKGAKTIARPTGKASYKFKFKKGTYLIKAMFIGADGDIFNDSAAKPVKVKIKKKR